MTISDARRLAHIDQQPRCVQRPDGQRGCQRRHRPDLPCWKGAYRDEITALVLASSATCWICRGVATTADHIVPRSRGGDDELANLRPACRRCNSSRGANPNPFQPEQPTAPAGVPLSERWRT